MSTPDEPRRRESKEPPIPPTAQMLVVATLGFIAVMAVFTLGYAAIVKGVESALTQMGNLAVLVLGILAGLVAGKHGSEK